MFSATAHQVAKALGKETLLPVPSINTADNIEILRIVIKKRRKWLFFTRKPHYETTEFTLSDVLLGEHQKEFEVLPLDTHVLTAYNSKSNLSLKGKFGADLTKELLDVKLGSTDSVVVSSQLGVLNKTEISTPKLLHLLEKKKIDLHHPLISVVKDNGHKTLCIITSIIHLKDNGKITSDVDLEGDGEFDSKPLSVDLEGDVKEDKSKSMVIPKNTSIAFSMVELLVSVKDGSIQVILSHDENGGFTTENFDVTDGPVHPECPEEILKVFKENGKCKEVLRSVQHLLQTPKSIRSLMELEVELSHDLNILQAYTKQNLYDEFDMEESHNYHPFLLLADFHFKDEKLLIPDESSSMFNACHFLLTLLHELDEDNILDVLAQCLMVTKTTLNTVPVLRKLKESKDHDIKFTEEMIEKLTATPINDLMFALEIVVKPSSLLVHVPSRSRLDLQATYYILNSVLQ
ncbi:hypothetical protein LOTGIDRAFT_171685 [Lottia gigantea]|uniref:Gasdermin pore forming domain-containing protein n=1 Tax=Lottia gigantea TaxID=225164 RepID=V4CLM6_LOTGI|nr:hypothetical protein LOTGIDRAFT_171685 [Lottia gigantea]ESP03200.1 hypothetical protein LOTGIDRAFT_171685 [Lottia gigantea]